MRATLPQMMPPPPPPPPPPMPQGEDGRLLPAARDVLVAPYRERIEIGLASVPPLTLSDEARERIRRGLYAVVDRCAEPTRSALRDAFVDGYGKATRNNLIFLYGAAGTGKTTLADAMLAQLERPTLEAGSLQELLSTKFRAKLM